MSGSTDTIVSAVRAANDGRSTVAEAIAAVSVDDVEAVLHAQVQQAGDVLASGIGASPGAAVGRAYFTADAVLDAVDRGEEALLVCGETSPADEPAMREAVGVVTARGGMSSHAAVVARGWGIPAVVGTGGIDVQEGTVLTVDGSAGTVIGGAIEVAEEEVPSELFELLAWADEAVGGKPAVRANADTPENAQVAREFGAVGIGLCRTEHMFLGEGLPVIQRVLRGQGGEDEFVDVQRAHMSGVLEAMDGLPVTVRLLDPPVHEFLPDDDDWIEANPMIGTRGVRLGVVKPAVYRLQARALRLASADRLAAGGDPRLEVMIPLVVSGAEVKLMRSWLEDELDGLRVPVGTMVETPRAALSSGEIAAVADFFSFGTNDLTQMTLGFCRDDIESRIMDQYLELGLLAANPFQRIDAVVADLVEAATREGRATDPGLSVGVCGEHGGDPESIHRFATAGVDYVSCSPYRVPVARLAAAKWA